jgi:hypothetical protein
MVTSHARLNDFARGMAYGLWLAGWSLSRIAGEVRKTDNTSPSQQSIKGTVEALQSSGLHWGVDALPHAGGVKRATPKGFEKAVLKLVFSFRGSAKVTINFVKKKLKSARKFSNRTIGRRLHEAGLAWLSRRRKSRVSAEHRRSRVKFAKWVQTLKASTLKRWAYTDGTVFYLARTHVEKADKKVAALGKMVWRKADGSDGLYQDCVGASSYAKGQGYPVKLWGYLLNGKFFVSALRKGMSMNSKRYSKFVRKHFLKWTRKALGKKNTKQPFLVQDHERCLWTEESQKAIREAGVRLLENYPKSSQDLNAIETCWRELRERLYVTEPTDLETRCKFLRRMHKAVAWVNKHRKKYLLELCNDQKERANDVLCGKPPGARTGH